jgi:malonyl-CoA/methylmalonyl-CoA synthetase
LKNSNFYALTQSGFPDDEEAVFLEHERGVLKYSELDSFTGSILSLFKQLGVNKADRTIVQVDKSPETIVLYLACLRAGVIYIPLNTAYTVDEVAYFIEDAEPSLIVCDPETEESISSLASRFGVSHVLTLDARGKGSFMESIQDIAVEQAIEQCAPDDLASILYTSGTTGRAKGAMLSHGNLASNALALNKSWQWQDDDVLLHALPVFHVHGLFISLHCALLKGTRVIYLNKFDLELIKQNLPRVTVMMGVPTYYVRLLANPEFDRDLCKNIRLFSSGSAPLLPETFDLFERRTGLRIIERYGMTETVVISSNPFDGERIAGTVGFALPGIDIRIGDEQGAELPGGETGMLQLTGPNVFQGYWRMPEKTAEEFTDDGYFITGDLACIDEDGRVSIVGRVKDLVISGGYNVYPKEVELVIDEIEGVNESAIIGLAHEDFGEAVTAIIVRDSEELSAEEIIAQLKGKIARFKQPRQIVFVGALPRNTMGKVQKNILRENYKELYNE